MTPTTSTPTPSDLTVVIPNWNTADLTMRCVETLLEEGVPAARIVLVENGSTDDSYERLEQALPECHLIRFEQNVGYGRAMNAGAKVLEGSAYLLMNNDAFVHTRGSVGLLLAALDDASVGLAFPRYLNVDLSLQPSVMPTHSPTTALVRASGLSRFVPNKWAPKLSTHWDHDQAREIDGANGAVMMFRGETWNQLGGFDERIYIYAEEIDICWRTRKLGWRIWFNPEAQFMHLGGGSIGKQWSDATRERLIAASESRVIRWHLSRASAAATLGLISTGIAMRWLAYSVVRNKEAAAAYRASLGGYLEPYGSDAPVDGPARRLADLGDEAVLGEPLRSLPDHRRVQGLVGRALHCLPDVLDASLLDQPTGLSAHDDVGRTSLPERDHGRTARLRFRHRDPEVLVRGEDEGARAPVEVPQLLVRHLPEEGHVRHRRSRAALSRDGRCRRR